MLTALYDKLAIDPCMRLKDMVAFLYGEFEVDINRFSIRRALRMSVGPRKLHKISHKSVTKTCETSICMRSRPSVSASLFF